MKDSDKRRIVTKEKQKTFQALSEDKILNRMFKDCKDSGINEAYLILITNYCYQYGYDAGLEAGTAQGIEYAYQHINDLIDKYVPPKGAKNEDR
jgi:hypothetical protein